MEKLDKEGALQPQSESGAVTPEWVTEKQAELFQKAKQLGIASEVERLMGMGFALTAQKIRIELTKNNPEFAAFAETQDTIDVESIIRVTREKLGIPNPESEKAEFKEWQDKWTPPKDVTPGFPSEVSHIQGPKDANVEHPEPNKNLLGKLREKIKEHLAVEDEGRVKEVLEGIGCKATKKDLEKVVALFKQNLEELTDKIAEKLFKKYDKDEKYISELLDADLFHEIVNDSMAEIEKEVNDAAKNYYQQVWSEKKSKGRLTPAQQDNGHKLTEDLGGEKTVQPINNEKLSDAGRLTIDRSGDNAEQKELRKKISELFRKNVEETVEKIGTNLANIKSNPDGSAGQEIDEERLNRDKERISQQLLENLDAHAGLILNVFRNDLKDELLDQYIRIEIGRTVGNSFGNSKEIAKVLPKDEMPRREISQNVLPAMVGEGAKRTVNIAKDTLRETEETQKPVDFSKFEGLLSKKLIKRAEKTEEQDRAEIIELLKAWDYVRRNLEPREIILMETLLEEGAMNVYRAKLEEEKNKEGFNIHKFNNTFLEDIETVLRRRQINKRDKLDLFRMYFEQAFVVEQKR
jgi:hypothetical protein